MEYFSVTFMVPMMDSVSVSHSATSSPMAMESARSCVGREGNGYGPEEAVLAGQAVGFAAALPVVPAHKPSSGVNAPMPIMIRSLVSRLVIGTFFRHCAFLLSSSKLRPLQQKRIEFLTAVRRNQIAHS